MTAAADDRSFAFAVQAPASEGSLTRATTRVYLTRLDTATRQTTVTSVPDSRLRAGAVIDALALSLDGTKLAIAFEPNPRAATPSEDLRVISLATGTSRTWTGSRGLITGETAFQQCLNWAADGTTLAFSWYAGQNTQAGGPLAPGSGFRLLNTAGPAGNLIAGSRLAVPFMTRNHQAATSAGYLSGYGILAPDGKTISTAVTAFRGHEAEFATFSTVTGQLEHAADRGQYRTPAGPAPVMVLWSSADAQTLIVYSPPGHPSRLGILHDGHLTLLPRNPKANPQISAW